MLTMLVFLSETTVSRRSVMTWTFIFMVISTSLILVCAFITLQKRFFKHDVYVQFYASLCCCLWRTHKKSFLHHLCASRLFNQQHFNIFSSFCLRASGLFTIRIRHPPKQRQSRLIKQFNSSFVSATRGVSCIKVFVNEREPNRSLSECKPGNLLVWVDNVMNSTFLFLSSSTLCTFEV